MQASADLPPDPDASVVKMCLRRQIPIAPNITVSHESAHPIIYFPMPY
ncbi:MAG: hypothetical protein ABI183_02135 [Polyangiaceae bacterium]